MCRALRQRLAERLDVAPWDAAALVRAVGRYQGGAGLKADGKAGAQTLVALLGSDPRPGGCDEQEAAPLPAGAVARLGSLALRGELTASASVPSLELLVEAMGGGELRWRDSVSGEVVHVERSLDRKGSRLIARPAA